MLNAHAATRLSIISVLYLIVSTMMEIIVLSACLGINYSTAFASRPFKGAMPIISTDNAHPVLPVSGSKMELAFLI